MIRWPLAGLAGASLALLLFWGLALLVAPPEADVEVRETAVTMSMATALEPPTEASAAPAPAPRAPPAPRPAPPSPPPPAPMPDSSLSLPEPTLADPPPVQPEEVAELDTALPELTEAAPTPEPEPEPEPEPQPEPPPSPEPASPSATATDAAATEPPATSGQGPPSADGQARQAVQDVGQATPTRRVPPSYPRRAQRRGLEGHVVVEFLIRPDGRVKSGSVRVIEARPRRVFDEAATRAVADWRFEADGRLRRARQRLEFQLR